MNIRHVSTAYGWFLTRNMLLALTPTMYRRSALLLHLLPAVPCDMVLFLLWDLPGWRQKKKKKKKKKNRTVSGFLPAGDAARAGHHQVVAFVRIRTPASATTHRPFPSAVVWCYRRQRLLPPITVRSDAFLYA